MSGQDYRAGEKGWNEWEIMKMSGKIFEMRGEMDIIWELGIYNELERLTKEREDFLNGWDGLYNEWEGEGKRWKGNIEWRCLQMKGMGANMSGGPKWVGRRILEWVGRALRVSVWVGKVLQWVGKVKNEGKRSRINGEGFEMSGEGDFRMSGQGFGWF